MASVNFPDLTPPGTTPTSQGLQQSLSKPPFPPAICAPSDWSCGVANFFGTVGNGLAGAVAVGGSMMGLFFALITFQLPAFQVLGSFGILLNALIVFPIIAICGLFGLRILKGLIPTIGGETD